MISLARTSLALMARAEAEWEAGMAGTGCHQLNSKQELNWNQQQPVRVFECAMNECCMHEALEQVRRELYYCAREEEATTSSLLSHKVLVVCIAWMNDVQKGDSPGWLLDLVVTSVWYGGSTSVFSLSLSLLAHIISCATKQTWMSSVLVFVLHWEWKRMHCLGIT